MSGTSTDFDNCYGFGGSKMGVGEGSMPPTPLGTVWGERGVASSPPRDRKLCTESISLTHQNTNPVLMHCNYN